MSETLSAVSVPTGGSRSSVLIRGMILGSAFTALVFGGVLLLRGGPAPAARPKGFTTVGSEVRLTQDVTQPLPFETAAVEAGTPLPLPPITARIAAVESRTAPSYAPLDGRVDHVAVRLGDSVAAGARLALIRSGDLATMLRELRTSAALAQTKRALADRMKILVGARGASSNDLLVAQNDLRDAELQARAADSRLKSLSIASAEDNQYWLLAPRSGTVIQIDAVPGQQVGPGKERPVVTLADLDEVLVMADVAQQDAASLRAGDPVDIRAPGDNDSLGQGRIENVSQVVDQDRQTVPIRIHAKNPDGRMRPNAFVEAHFAAGSKTVKSVLRVPSASVVSDGMESAVFVQIAPGHFKRTEVALGRQHHGLTEIRAGLKEGQRVVSRGALLLLNAIDLEE